MRRRNYTQAVAVFTCVLSFATGSAHAATPAKHHYVPRAGAQTVRWDHSAQHGRLHLGRLHLGRLHLG